MVTDQSHKGGIDPTTQQHTNFIFWEQLTYLIFKKGSELIDDVRKVGLMDVRKISLQKGNGVQNLFPKVLKNPKINKPNYSKGNNIIRLGSLIKWWSKQPKKRIPRHINLNPQIKEGNQPPIIKFEPYTLKSDSLFTSLSV